MIEQAWLVDLDGTLYHAGPVKLFMGMELLCAGWQAIPILRRFRIEHEGLRSEGEPSSESPYTRQLLETAKKSGIDVAEVNALVEEWMIERPTRYLRWFARKALFQEIAAYKEAGGKTALVSDYPAKRKLEALGVQELFDVVVANGEESSLSRLKPSPEGYLLAAEKLEVQAASCLVIGDRPDADGMAARRAGMAFRKV